MKTNSNSQPPAAGEMTRLSDDLTHFFAKDHFNVKKAEYMEAEIERLRNAHTGLVEALELIAGAFDRYGRDALDFSAAEESRIRAALAATKQS